MLLTIKSFRVIFGGGDGWSTRQWSHYVYQNNYIRLLSINTHATIATVESMLFNRRRGRHHHRRWRRFFFFMLLNWKYALFIMFATPFYRLKAPFCCGWKTTVNCFNWKMCCYCLPNASELIIILIVLFGVNLILHFGVYTQQL